MKRVSARCFNCRTLSNNLHTTPKHSQLCSDCITKLRKAGVKAQTRSIA